ncbi:hypothetical protein HYU12_05330 [Candidatus Woesearchaeota archaeon]|nr:hypothetical protein [Candidatus Woesearchaeota archaeon]
MKKFSASTKVFFAALFIALVFLSSKVNFSALVGKPNQFFTLFQFFGPVAGGILGPVVGSVVVFSSSAATFIINLLSGKASFDLVTVLRLLPMVFAAWYFGTKKHRLSAVVPVAAIAMFLAHPVGRQVWFFPLIFWTIPVIAKFFPNRLFLRSLGATFTAHAVGGAVWIWTVPMTPEAWTALIPVVIVERLLFASGIALSFVAANTLLHRIEAKVPFISVDKRYVLSRSILKYF